MQPGMTQLRKAADTFGDKILLYEEFLDAESVHEIDNGDGQLVPLSQARVCMDKHPQGGYCTAHVYTVR